MITLRNCPVNYYIPKYHRSRFNTGRNQMIDLAYLGIQELSEVHAVPLSEPGKIGFIFCNGCCQPVVAQDISKYRVDKDGFQHEDWTARIIVHYTVEP